jgi:alkylhydroperoxidase family enzyme
VLLGRAPGLTEEKLAHLGDDPPSAGVCAPGKAVIVRYAQRCTRMEVIGDVTFADLAAHYEPAQIIEICLTVGMSNMINRFPAAFRTEVDPQTGEALAPACPFAYPNVPEG